jgi:mono/diheme cytochrome c family protein
MKPFKTAILITLGIAYMIPVAVGQESQSKLEAAKEKGRNQSRYLKETKSAQEASDTVPEANIGHYRKSVEPILRKSCVACHGAKKAKSGLRIDQLNPDMLAGRQHQSAHQEQRIVDDTADRARQSRRYPLPRIME